MKNERKVLVSALLKAEKSGYSNIVLDNVLAQSDLDRSAAAFVTKAFYGVLERKISLDYILNKYLKRPINKAPPYTSAVLRSGAYQILFMDKVPSSAAVNESVKLIKKSKEGGNSALVNAVLRNIDREIKSSDLLTSAQPSVRFSVNDWIYSAIKNDYGNSKANAFFENALMPPPVFVRINPLNKNAKQTLLAELEPLGGSLLDTGRADMYIAKGIRSMEGLKAFKAGDFFVQDMSSRMAAAALGAKSGERIFDCCAAPGGKSFSLAMDMENKGEILSADLYAHRVELIKSGALRLGLNIVKPIISDATVFNAKLSSFDRVLCDVPCSGIGVIRRKPEIKYKSDEECAALPQLQLSILKTAARYVKSGGRLLYSTCTLLKRENEDVVLQFLKENTEFKSVPLFEDGPDSMLTFMPPDDDGDGFFMAAMERM